ncbi:ATP-dependent DNA helicase [Clostridium sp. 19966]|uniref:ATP-dependent DNA helicase n=1 Tax=Clostridium sp. 19966 TaxID=2768166 RepID=UPI0028E9DFB3|nr:ATP-dependent DNA helicase [Clostridium sp. 19966]
MHVHDIDLADEEKLKKYIEDNKFKGEYKYLFTFENYIFAVKENKCINTYYVINIKKNKSEIILRSKKIYSEELKDILIERLLNSSNYEVKLKDDPEDMIEFIFIKLMAENGFKIRENQIELSKAMYRGIIENKIAICEAAVGTGKTYAYIVACLVHSLYERQRKTKYIFTNEGTDTAASVISTSSIELQNAIIKDYVPKLSRILQENKIINKPIKAVLRKGKEHYFCIKRYERFMNYLKSSNKAIDKELLQKLNELQIPDKGIDLDEYKGLKNHILQKINVPKACDRSCYYFDRCNYLKHLEYMKSSEHDFQVCNHNYYLADAVKRASGKRTLIPEHFAVVVDEAHKLNDAAAQIFGKKLSSEDITMAINIMNSSLKGNKAYLKIAKSKLQELNKIKSSLFNSLISKGNLSDIEENSQIQIKLSRYEKKLLYNMKQKILDIKTYCNRDIIKNRNIQFILDELEENIRVFQTDRIIYWLENPINKDSICLSCVPKDLERQLNKVLWESGSPKILTSATLSDDKGFDYFKSNTGINILSKNNIKEISVVSPFNFKENTLLYISEKIPYPNKQSEEYITALSEEISKIIEVSFGHAVILFTSYSLMSKIYENIQNIIKYPTMKMNKSEKNIIERFKNSRNGVLFATGSFWEGVDCPGDILSSLIVVNLPFIVPTPIIDEKKKAYENLKEFIDEVIFPEMLIKLKQGIGRLVRCETDTGVISILDARINKDGKYRRRVLEALKDYKVTDSIDEVRRFFRKVKSEDYFL